MEKIKLTDSEFDLIMAIRNYQKSYPNGYPGNMLVYRTFVQRTLG